MKRICVVCEGQTEETFVRDVLAPSMYGLGLNLVPQMISTSPGHKGGALRYDRVQRHLRNTLRQNSAPIVTTLIDLYRLDGGFPGFATSMAQPDLHHRLEVLNKSLHADIVSISGCKADRFIPYIQPHEFEALLFSDVDALTELEHSWKASIPALKLARDASSSPEHINDRPETKPAAYLERILRNPRFHKTRHGPIAAQKIGLTRIESECAFFAGWLNQIRSLSCT